MRYFLGSVAALATLAAPLLCHAADSPVLAVAKSLCIANHADSDRVAAAAMADGWQRQPPSIELEPGETALVRSVNGVTWLLSLTTQDNSQFGLPPSHYCRVSARSGEIDLIAAVSEFVGAKPLSTREGGAAIWYYVVKSGLREVLPDANAMTVASALNKGPVMSIFVRGGNDTESLTMVLYSEIIPDSKPAIAGPRKHPKRN